METSGVSFCASVRLRSLLAGEGGMQAGWWKSLYVQVLFAITAGILLGYFYPDFGASLKPLGDGFIALVKMIIGPVIFLTVALGIAQMGDLKKVGRVGFKAVVYFEILTTI